jgi:tetratricopeptide (TPR) repeat protein
VRRRRRLAPTVTPLRAAVLALFAFALTLLGAPAAVRAATPDEQIASQTKKIVEEDVANANFGEARKKLRGLQDRCKKVECSQATVGQVHIALGMIAAQLGQNDDAKAEFSNALAADPNAQLPDKGVTQAMKTQFAEAQKAAASAGWQNKTAYDLAQGAITAESEGKWEDCAEKDRQSIKVEDQPRTRLHLATCLGKNNKVLDALRETQKALEMGIDKKDTVVIAGARSKVAELLPRIAKITFIPPQGVTDLVVTFDDRAIPPDQVGKKFSVDPGKHRVHAHGTQSGTMLAFDKEYEIADGQNLNVAIVLNKTYTAGILTVGQIECMQKAKSQEDVQLCVGTKERGLVFRAGLEMAGYTDTTDVHVLTPGVTAGVSSPTAGWNANVGYLLDVVTAASPDIVSSASKSFKEKRHVISAGGGYKPGNFGAQANANVSSEPDYLSRTLGLSLLGDFRDKMISPKLSFSYTWDTIGRAPMSFDTYSKPFTTVELSPQTTFVLSPTALAVIGFTYQIERGDQSKPYRYIPMFDDTAAIPRGASIEQVNAERLNVKPLEQLPVERDRYALAARYIKRVGGSATLRVEERLYYDSWQTMATSTDARYMIDVNPTIRIWPHLRAHFQTAANFYKRVPRAKINTDATVDLPAFRSTDRELSTLLTVTAGGGARFTLSREGAKLQYGVTVTADAMYTRYFSALYIQQRLAVYGAVGFDVEFE